MATNQARWIMGPSLATAVAALPFLTAIRDTTFSFATVKGESMAPTLKSGDVVLVRRRDFPSWLVGLITGESKDDVQKRVDRNDWMQGIMATQLTTVPGEIVVVRNPLVLNNNNNNNNNKNAGVQSDRLYIKRVIGVGGQWLVHSNLSNAFRLEELPSYTVFVQGDNVDHSIDSRLLGPISRNLVVGKAEYIVWPPSRWQRLVRTDEDVLAKGGTIRAVWSRDDLGESDDDR
jgi:signal peptidase I